VRVTCEVSTKDRYEVLSQALLSLALQTTKDFSVIIFDDADEPPRSADALVQRYPAYGEVFQLFQEFKIPWQVVYGQKRGQHFNHQAAQKIATTEWIFRFDDDEVLEPDVLGRLLEHAREDVGAVAGLVLPPGPLPISPDAANVITDLNRPNIQWFTQPPRVVEVDHLHSTFLYRRGLVDYELSLSPAAHREETLFTYELKRKGYKLLVDTSVVTWHFRAATGGIRSHHHPEYWENDEKIFQSKLLEWGVNCEAAKPIVLDCGRGDHVIVKSLLPRLKEKHGKLIIASCFPDILNGEEQISIDEARQRWGNLDRFSIYRWCIEHNWTGNLVTAFEKMYELE
jgi:GT2 family glycosyltransferase